jgi:dihydroneopterin aldolase
VARLIVDEFGVPWVCVSIGKPGAIEGSREVGVIIERTAADYD